MQFCFEWANTFSDDLQRGLFNVSCLDVIGLRVPIICAELQHCLQRLWPLPLTVQRAPLARRLIGGRVVRVVAPAVLLQVLQQQLPQCLHCEHTRLTQLNIFVVQ